MQMNAFNLWCIMQIEKETIMMTSEKNGCSIVIYRVLCLCWLTNSFLIPCVPKTRNGLAY